MDVKTLCLGLLTFGAASGYDLKKLFEECFRSFYSAGYGSIYPALAYLAETDLVTCEEVSQDGRPDRKVYRITDAGREYFMKSLAHQAPAHKVRSEFLAMMFFSHLMDDHQIHGLLKHRLEDMQRTVDQLGDMASTPFGRRQPGVEFVAGFCEAVAKAGIDYIENNRDALTDTGKPRLASFAAR